MKKSIFVGLMLAMVLGAQAQLKVAPKMQMGDQKDYVTVTKADIPGQGAVSINIETSYSVSEVLADGFVVKIETTKVTSDATADNIAGQLLAAAQEVMLGTEVKVATNNEGKPLRITNYAEVKNKINQQADVFIDKMLKAIPQLEQMMSKDALKQQITENTTEEAILASFQACTNPMALNGKTIMTGAQDEYTNDQGVKMKRMYFVNGQTVTTNSTMNMTKDEMKQFIIDQVTKIMPEQAEMVKQNIDQLMATGMMNIDMKETATYEVQTDGWVKSIKLDTTNETMGQKMTVNTTMTLK